MTPTRRARRGTGGCRGPRGSGVGQGGGAPRGRHADGTAEDHVLHPDCATKPPAPISTRAGKRTNPVEAAPASVVGSIPTDAWARTRGIRWARAWGVHRLGSSRGMSNLTAARVRARRRGRDARRGDGGDPVRRERARGFAHSAAAAGGADREYVRGGGRGRGHRFGGGGDGDGRSGHRAEKRAKKEAKKAKKKRRKKEKKAKKEKKRQRRKSSSDSSSESSRTKTFVRWSRRLTKKKVQLRIITLRRHSSAFFPFPSTDSDSGSDSDPVPGSELARFSFSSLPFPCLGLRGGLLRLRLRLGLV